MFLSGEAWWGVGVNGTLCSPDGSGGDVAFDLSGVSRGRSTSRDVGGWEGRTSMGEELFGDWWSWR